MCPPAFLNLPYPYCNLYSRLFVSSFLTQSLQKCKKCRACQPCTPVTKSLKWKVREMMVSSPSELAEIPIPSLSQSRLQRYRPIPVELLIIRPFCPVNPFSKIRGRSLAGMPMPLSQIDRIMLSFSLTAKNVKVVGLYGILLRC